MAPSAIHHDNATALLVIDVQHGLFQRANPVYQADVLIDRLNALMAYARDVKIPVYLIQHANAGALAEGSEGWQLHPGLHVEPSDVRVHKRHGCAFQAADLAADLAERGMRTLLVTGLVTHGCVKTTCVEAKGRGYRVILVEDAHSNYHRDADDVIQGWNRILRDRGIVELRSTQAILSGGV